ncbi:hypothetical protein [Goodfellowiella coeruleoviolacea]|uniref:Short chain dehydrogenase n=1 Tax=Goodfellowiella coeruleoviolacea TaxID=334858 RepID=A0AAE3KDU3_9PSEU|nr:hypothetical protein [Goodfellowiella coeruleoviolacea]MCP2164496.1 short chain dehydrogenase [Goodfellowiella coeruleoviolacea]
MIAVTGASGQLGRATIGHLVERVDAARVVAVTRTPARAADLGGADQGGRLRRPGLDGARR